MYHDPNTHLQLSRDRQRAGYEPAARARSLRKDRARLDPRRPNRRKGSPLAHLASALRMPSATSLRIGDTG